MSKLRDKTRKYNIDEDNYDHPQHQPYKRPKYKDWHNHLLDDESEFPEEEEEND